MLGLGRLFPNFNPLFYSLIPSKLSYYSLIPGAHERQTAIIFVF